MCARACRTSCLVSSSASRAMGAYLKQFSVYVPAPLHDLLFGRGFEDAYAGARDAGAADGDPTP